MSTNTTSFIRLHSNIDLIKNQSFPKKYIEFSTFFDTILIESKRLGSGLAKPTLSGAKASLICCDGVFAPLSSLAYGRGFVGYKTGATRKPRNQ